MNIVFIITDYGSFNNFLGELAIELLSYGHSVSVICDRSKVINTDDKYPYEEYGVKFYYLQFSINFSLYSKYITSKKINSIVNKINPDIINIHFTTGVFISVLSGKLKAYTIGIFHGLNYPVEENPLKKFVSVIIEKFCFRRIDKIHLINNLDYNTVKKLHPLKCYKYNSFGVGCDIVKFNPGLFSLNKKCEIKKELNINEDDFIVAFTGRFVKFKGFDLVIRAVKLLEEEYKVEKLKLILIGGEDPAHSNGLNSQENEYYRKSKSIINVGFTSEVEKYLSIADLFVFPSKKEGVPVSIMESIAMGIPVITLNARGCNDIITNNYNGILLDTKVDHKDISKEIFSLMNDKNKLLRLSENCLEMRTKVDRYFFIKESIDLIINSRK
jgi:glycosyltransferase involved in cell wall biosynthesis